MWIGKEDGSQRPIGIPAFEDKILQRAVAMILVAIYEIHFYDFSYSFRENLSAHQAIKSMQDTCYKDKVSVVFDADISKFFENIPHDRIRKIVKLRITDGHILRIIGGVREVVTG